jgi:hypothetical protein
MQPIKGERMKPSTHASTSGLWKLSGGEWTKFRWAPRHDAADTRNFGHLLYRAYARHRLWLELRKLRSHTAGVSVELGTCRPRLSNGGPLHNTVVSVARTLRRLGAAFSALHVKPGRERLKCGELSGCESSTRRPTKELSPPSSPRRTALHMPMTHSAARPHISSRRLVPKPRSQLHVQIPSRGPLDAFVQDLGLPCLRIGLAS